MKDYYDIYYLANKFVDNRGHIFTVEQFERVMGFADDSAMQKKYSYQKGEVTSLCNFSLFAACFLYNLPCKFWCFFGFGLIYKPVHKVRHYETCDHVNDGVLF